jgi:biopolymer transport protein ExbB/TolQ
MHLWGLGLPLADVHFAFGQSNLAGKVIVVILFVGSIFVWSVMVMKIRELLAARQWSERFVRAYRREAHPASLMLKRQNVADCPLFRIYEKTCSALGRALESEGVNPDDLFMGGVGATHRKINSVDLSSVRNVAERTVADQVLLLEESMGLLATAATTAPFLGLLGTVWGVMEAFQGMGESALLSAVAPGISGALLTTVVGLLVALPSAIGYNMLSDQIRRMTVIMDNFAQELGSDLDRQYLRVD